MKKVLLFISLLFLILTLIGCSSEKTMTCELEGSVLIMVYTNDELLSMTVSFELMGEFITETIDNSDEEALALLNSDFIAEYGDDIPAGVEQMRQEAEEDGFTCSVE